MPHPVRILCLLLIGLACPARAGDAEPLQKIRVAAQDFVSARLGGEVQANAAALDTRLRLPACGGDLQTSAVTPNAGNAWSVAVHCSGPAIWTLYVPVRASEHRQVVVAIRPLPPGQPVPADALALQERDVAVLPYGYVGHIEDAAGKVLRRPAAMGSALTPDMLNAPASIRRGQEVTLVSQAGGFAVRAAGKALADGAPGDRVHVENLDSHRVVEGVVRDADTIEVGM